MLEVGLRQATFHFRLLLSGAEVVRAVLFLISYHKLVKVDPKLEPELSTET